MDYDAIVVGSRKKRMQELESKHTCCCNTKETGDQFTMETQCRFFKNHLPWGGSCLMKGLTWVTMRDGGCLDMDIVENGVGIDVSREGASSCGFMQKYCCCNDQ